MFCVEGDYLNIGVINFCIPGGCLSLSFAFLFFLFVVCLKVSWFVICSHHFDGAVSPVPCCFWPFVWIWPLFLQGLLCS